MPPRDTEVLTQIDHSFMDKCLAAIREKAMVPDFGFFERTVARLCCGAIVLTFFVIAQASAARSAILDLSCAAKDESATANIRFQIDTDRRGVVEIAERGNYQYIITMISDQFIKYQDPDKGKDNVHALQDGTFDRIAGTLVLNITVGGQITGSSHWLCRRTTQKF